MVLCNITECITSNTPEDNHANQRRDSNASAKRWDLLAAELHTLNESEQEATKGAEDQDDDEGRDTLTHVGYFCSTFYLCCEH